MELTFTSDGVLRGAGMELARVALAPGSAFATITVATESYEIVRPRRSGWQFELEQVTPTRRDVVCRFAPNRFRRGGLLESELTTLRLIPKLLRGWSMSIPGQPDVAVRIRRRRSGRRVTLSTSWEAELVLVSE